MDINRPDLTGVAPDILAYIQSLEAEIAELAESRLRPGADAGEGLIPDEPPGPFNLITVTATGSAKRTPVHLYARQRRGGMGVFDLDTPEDDPPMLLSIAEESQTLLLITNDSRAFRIPLGSLPESPVHARGSSIVARINLLEGESLAAVLPIRAQGYLALLSKTGMVRCLRHHVFGEYMKPGLPLYDIKSFGPLASASWTPGDGDLLIATRQGRAIRFSEKQVPPQGCLGIRLASEDQAIAVAPVDDDSEVFFLGADGHGTVRRMNGFARNKTPGSGGKNAIATTHLVAVANVDGVDDLFIISRLGKIIRFRLDEVPVKEGVVQGVICMSFRADEASALATRRPNGLY